MSGARALWVIRATQKGRQLRACKGTLNQVMHVMIDAEKPLTGSEVAKKLFISGDDTAIRKSLNYLHSMKLLKTNRVPARGHPFASLECEYFLRDIDELLEKE